MISQFLLRGGISTTNFGKEADAFALFASFSYPIALVCLEGSVILWRFIFNLRIANPCDTNQFQYRYIRKMTYSNKIHVEPYFAMAIRVFRQVWRCDIWVQGANKIERVIHLCFAENFPQIPSFCYKKSKSFQSIGSAIPIIQRKYQL